MRPHILADKLGDTPTANTVIDAIIEHSDEWNMIPDAAEVVAGSTAPQSPLRRLFVDYYIHEASMESMEQLLSLKTVSKEFTCEVLREKYRLVELDNPDESKKISDIFVLDFTGSHKCRYHQHDESHPRCSEDSDGSSDSGLVSSGDEEDVND